MRLQLYFLVSTAVSTSSWQLFNDTNAVMSLHDPKNVMWITNITSTTACEALADLHKASIFTWHDLTVEPTYRLHCALRLDSKWIPISQSGHHSGIKGPVPPAPTPDPPTPRPPSPAPVATPPCSLNGVLDNTGGCSCDSGWIGKHCGQLDLHPAPPLASQVTSKAALTSDNGEANATWGMSVVGPLNGVYHGYMTEIANECYLGEYGEASQVVHMTSTSPLGPWSRQGIALRGFAHNPQAVLSPNASTNASRILLFHIGAELKPGCLLDCRGTTPKGPSAHPPKPRPSSCTKTLSHAASVAVAASPYGPWVRHPYIFSNYSSHQTNPAPWVEPDGTLYVALRRSTSSVQPIFIGHFDTPTGPWRLLNAQVLATAAGSPSTYEEDPFLYKTSRGWHMITRRASAADMLTRRASTADMLTRRASTADMLTRRASTVDMLTRRASTVDSPSPHQRLGRVASADVGGAAVVGAGTSGGQISVESCPAACRVTGGCFSPCYTGEPACGGGHLYSTNLSTWYFGEAVYHCALNMSASDGQSRSAAASTVASGDASGAVEGAEGLGGVGVTEVTLTSRERPTIFHDSSDNSLYLYTGASVNFTMYYHSFTLAQQIRTGNGLSTPP
jgi:hypothetical protein